MKPLKAVALLTWFRSHQGLSGCLRVPGTTKQATLHDSIQNRIEELCILNNVYVNALCDNDKCWCSTVASLSGTVALLLPRLSSPDQNDENKLYRFDSSGFSVIVRLETLPRTQSTNACVVVAFCATEVQRGSFLEIQDTTGLQLTWKPEATEAQRAAFAEDVIRLTQSSDNLCGVPETEITSFLALANLLDRLWAPADTMTRQELVSCTHEALHSHSQLSQLLPRCIFVQLPPLCIQWLLEDGIYLGLDLKPDAKTQTTVTSEPLSSVDSFSSFNDTSSEDDDTSSDRLSDDGVSRSAAKKKLRFEKTDEFKQLSDCIAKSLASLGGCAVPRLLWSTPKDAVWITTRQSLMCFCARDVFLLLKASQWIVHDLECAFANAIDVIQSDESLSCSLPPTPVMLGLNAAVDIHDGFEFRVFFWFNRILGVSQRDLETSYPSLTERRKDDVIKAISDFFYETFLPISLPIDRGAFDIYFLPHHSNKSFSSRRLKCRLLSVSSWGTSTDPLLFTYDELRQTALTMPDQDTAPDDTQRLFDFRVVLPDAPRRCNPESLYRVPKDIWDVHMDQPNAESIVEELRRQSKV